MANILKIWDESQQKYVVVPTLKGASGIYYGENPPKGNEHPIWIRDVEDSDEEIQNNVYSVNGKKANIAGNVDIWGDLDNAVNEANKYTNTFVRPNLLDNWYFGNPVNQRGVTTQNASGYCIDRWKKDANYSVSVNDGYIRLVTGADERGFYQPIEPKTIDYLSGKIVTLSVLARGTAKLKLGVSRNYSDAVNLTDNWDIVQRTFIQPANAPAAVIRPFGGTCDIIAAKLELGSTQTLAHLEGDKWVLNEFPDYGEQLRRCQRYYYEAKYSKYATIGLSYEGPAYSFATVPLPVAMRSNTASVSQSAPIQIGNHQYTMTGAQTYGCLAILGQNYDPISDFAFSVYSYCPHDSGVTFKFYNDL